MDSRYLCCLDAVRKPNWEDLMEDFKVLKENVRVIQELNVPEEMKAPILKELAIQISEVKQKMHDYVDAL